MILVCTLQKKRRRNMFPSEEKFYSTLHKKNCIHHAYIDDIALPLSFPIQKFILGICTLKKLQFWTTTPLQKNLSSSIEPFRTSRKRPLVKISSTRRGEGGGGREAGDGDIK